MKIINFFQEVCVFAISMCLVAIFCNGFGIDFQLFYAAYHDATGSSFVPLRFRP